MIDDEIVMKILFHYFSPKYFCILINSFKKVAEKLNEDSFPSVCNRFNLEFKSLNRFNLFNNFIIFDDEIVMKILFHLFGSKFHNYFCIIFKKVTEKLNEDSFPPV